MTKASIIGATGSLARFVIDAIKAQLLEDLRKLSALFDRHPFEPFTDVLPPPE